MYHFFRYHHLAEPLQEEYFSDDNGGGHEPVPDSGLINGKGRYEGGPNTPWHVFNVVQGQRYRFRVINQSAFAQFRFAIQGHKMIIIEADGILHEPVVVDSFDIYAGQRYTRVDPVS